MIVSLVPSRHFESTTRVSRENGKGQESAISLLFSSLSKTTKSGFNFVHRPNGSLLFRPRREWNQFFFRMYTKPRSPNDLNPALSIRVSVKLGTKEITRKTISHSDN